MRIIRIESSRRSLGRQRFPVAGNEIDKPRPGAALTGPATAWTVQAEPAGFPDMLTLQQGMDWDDKEPYFPQYCCFADYVSADRWHSFCPGGGGLPYRHRRS